MILKPGTGNTYENLLTQTPPFVPEGAHFMVGVVTVPPGDPGAGPHRHSGPVFGYVLEGEILFELEGQEPYPIKAGEAFWEPGGEVVHYQAGNLRDDIASKFVVCMVCAPDIPMLTFLEDDEIRERDHLRHPSARQATSG
ncbi:cupin domain-containing protein [Amycolatopsis sp. NPDC048633]|uniref:cupin domain-containing protein n=1 Tax=Amycolatopsis sp. NPDC048633 TaxID=3157095 RepID=UPI0033CB7EC6